VGERGERRQLRLRPVQLEHLRLSEVEPLAERVRRPGWAIADAAAADPAAAADAHEEAVIRT
jgi:hypothetical protein